MKAYFIILLVLVAGCSTTISPVNDSDTEVNISELNFSNITSPVNDSDTEVNISELNFSDPADILKLDSNFINECLTKNNPEFKKPSNAFDGQVELIFYPSYNESQALNLAKILGLDVILYEPQDELSLLVLAVPNGSESEWLCRLDMLENAWPSFSIDPYFGDSFPGDENFVMELNTSCAYDSQCQWYSTNCCPEENDIAWECAGNTNPQYSCRLAESCRGTVAPPDFDCRCNSNQCVAAEKTKVSCVYNEDYNSEYDCVCDGIWMSYGFTYCADKLRPNVCRKRIAVDPYDYFFVQNLTVAGVITMGFEYGTTIERAKEIVIAHNATVLEYTCKFDGGFMQIEVDETQAETIVNQFLQTLYGYIAIKKVYKLKLTV